ncbi:MAG: phosphoglucomutase/phosphomannomutase family protein [Candidatus Margulisbacteria bacterium]|nr:phosphoglucomutase/phosphomannomutase family protein [Candidatus Margulisiibacteriota bacterium]
MTKIKFGTDGWRAVMPEHPAAKGAGDFSVENVEIVAQAMADHFKQTDEYKKGFIVGYDRRLNSEKFAKTAALVLAGNGFKVKCTAEECPTQVVSFHVLHHKACAGVMITASHNPPQYNGFKIKEAFGGSSSPELTNSIEKFIGKNKVQKGSEKELELFDPKPDYFAHVKKMVDLEKIAKAGVKVYVNPLFGSGAGYIPKILESVGLAATEINNKRDVEFGGFNPEPLDYNVPDLMEKIKKDNNDYAAGLILDGDADRNGACGTHGDFLNSQKVFSILIHHLSKNRGLKGKVIHAFNNSRMIAKIAKGYGLETVETKIGFKYIAEQILKGGALVGGEESGGYAIQGNIPDRDGITNSLILLEAMAYEKKSLDQIYADLENKFGKRDYGRIDLHLENEKKEALLDLLKNNTPKEFYGRKIVRKETLDGIKLNFEDSSWILFRASGTEPIIRIYVDALTKQDVEKMLAQGQELAEK